MPKNTLFESDRFPVLSNLLLDADLKSVDVGGRGSAFAPLRPLARFSRYYVAEPDVSEAERLKQELSQQWPWRSVTVITEAIASTRGTATLHVTSMPGMSSLLEPDPAVTRRYHLARKFSVVSTVTVPTVPLDEAADRHGFGDAAFIKLDTQGTELDILRSGERLLASVLGVNCEANFQPFYKGQAVFADIDSHLRTRGFSLFSLKRTLLRRAECDPSLYSSRVVVWAHCLYLREPETLLSDDAGLPRRRLTALLALALVFHQFDLAREVVATVRQAHLLDTRDEDALAHEVEEVCRYHTRRAVRRGQEEGVGADQITALTYRDDRRE